MIYNDIIINLSTLQVTLIQTKYFTIETIIFRKVASKVTYSAKNKL